MGRRRNHLADGGSVDHFQRRGRHVRFSVACRTVLSRARRVSKVRGRHRRERSRRVSCGGPCGGGGGFDRRRHRLRSFVGGERRRSGHRAGA